MCNADATATMPPDALNGMRKGAAQNGHVNGASTNGHRNGKALNGGAESLTAGELYHLLSLIHI